ncbi:MAG TPA: hypothetical protein VLB90_05210 [Pseudomonadales bacterium]|nr:hypothetical protein [Pseudomonadales bacterium]
MTTFWTGSALAADYGNTTGLRIQPGYGTLNNAIKNAMLAQFDDTDASVSVDEESAVMHCGYLECHHDVALHEFDAQQME